MSKRVGKFPVLEIELWSGEKVRVKTVNAKNMLDIMDKIGKLEGKHQEVAYKQWLAYYATVDENGEHLGTFNDFASSVDIEDIDRISKAYTRLLVGKAQYDDNLEEKDIEDIFEYLKGKETWELDGLVTFHLTQISKFLKESLNDESNTN